ncbi:spliceosomal protein [Martensiomyces pterosporus]|nr:spliceosomal protein [Martensiomyces pterosporus]
MASIPPNQTVYIRNLNDKIQKDTLRQSLYSLCVPYGRVLDIVALKTKKMRGQAFIVFSDITAATTALRQLNGRQFFGKPMRVEYALSKSDVVAQADGTFKFGEPRKHLSADQRKKLLGMNSTPGVSAKRRQSVQEEEEDGHDTKRRATEAEEGSGDEDDVQDMGDSESSDDMPAGADQVPAPTLFVTNLPESVSAEMLSGLFQEYSGFREVRRVPGKPDMAFVDYASATEASAARDVLNGFKLSADHAMKVDFSQ